MEKIELSFRVNGIERTVCVDPRARLLDVLREDLNLTGTKEGCGEGECGACTVILNGKAVDSCLLLAIQAENADVLTIEGLSDQGALHPIQKAFIDEGAVQCGFCTPGFIMSTYALLSSNRRPSREEIRESLEGNLCRCTGHMSIIRAVERAAAVLREEKDQ